ncbi:MAG: sigma-54-dependent Fis family transcriptional regulator, partial [Myxococcales bacterium]|nr:sigma-54-dependent Fis family transcriptional regulator [Myxococcales bacterium]
LNLRLGKRVTGIDDAAALRLSQYRWPGNVRELEHVIERAVLFADAALIREEDLPAEVVGPERSAGEDRGAATPAWTDPLGSDASFGEGLKEQVRAASARVERVLIERALRQTQGNVTHAARLLKISRKGLQLKMKELELRGE